jgi:hypothetical protein
MSSCPYSESELEYFADVDNRMGPECEACDEICHHNPRYDYENDCLEPEVLSISEIEESQCED